MADGLGLAIVDFSAASAGPTTSGYIWEIVRHGIQKFHATVVLFTDEESVDLGRSFRKPGDAVQHRQARPNVYIEAAFAMGLASVEPQ